MSSPIVPPNPVAPPTAAPKAKRPIPIFKVIHDVLGIFFKGAEVTLEDLGDQTDADRLKAIGAIADLDPGA